ncbi:acyl-CoA dehydrogenase [Sphingopyxis sp. GW247-27LB]|uniref:acyl-CoA dehydrogenase n=1 Tax=Sphingopyxis sp. GW247-27LB TaxID=2012632 RepID=UPI000BA726C2|nr:acyl-CoA dehydrogenase [Sphingopyxis sp. GW247-27LB]PAL21529.1 acyl-CoA dehydrogenase [Sphingopyxis sp. GW247-27LB]
MSLILSRRDIEFLLFDWLGVDALSDHNLYETLDRDIYTGVLDLAERLAADVVAPVNKIADSSEPVMLPDGSVAMPAEIGAALEALKQSGLFSAAQPAEYGGMQLPFVVEKAAFAWIQAASPAVSGYVLLTMAAANLLVEHGTTEQIDDFALPLLAGETFGTMCLSEPHAGSSLGDVRTRAVPDGDHYRLFGNKMWISGGEHSLSSSITHLVLARPQDAPPGVKGLSLFIVPRDLMAADGTSTRNDVSLAGLNHKMGQRGTVNTLLNFGEGRHRPQGASGAIGYLVGAHGDGLKLMFTMMNEARIGVGTSAAAIGYTGYLHALDYARSRPQGRLASDRNPSSSQVPIIEHADVRRMLLIQKSFVEGGLALNLYCASLVDRIRVGSASQRADLGLLLDLLTPIAKSWPSQFCLEANSLAIQVHGGYGYTRDYNVEQFYRDNRLNPIHEGTHGIQALDLLGRKVSMAKGAAFDLLRAEIGSSCERAGQAAGELPELGEAVEAHLARFAEITARLIDIEDPDTRLADAALYLEAAGHLVIGWIWLDLLLACEGEHSDFHAGKRMAGRYFIRRELPKIDPLLDTLHAMDGLVREADPKWF